MRRRRRHPLRSSSGPTCECSASSTRSTTRSRVNFFLNKFRKLGFIEYNGGLKINNSLLSVVLRD
jgi:hypothetical protein